MTKSNVLGRAVVEIDGDDSKLAKSLDGAKTKAQGLGSVMKMALATGAGFVLAQQGIQALGGAFGFLVGNAANFESALDGVQAATGATEDSMAKMRKEALRIGKDTSKSASEAVEAMGELAKAGMEVETILNGGADAAVALSEATGIGVPEAAVLVSNALNIWKDSAMSAKDAANIFAKSANASAISVSDLGMSLAAVGPILPSVGMSMEDFAVAMGLMGNNAMRGSDAGTSLKAMLSGLTPVSDKAKDSMKSLGFSAFDASGNFLKMPEIIANLAKSLKGMTQEQRAATLELWFGSDGLRAANVLLGEGVEGWDKFTKAMAAAPDVAEQARIRLDNLKGNIDRLKGTIETISITLGTMLLPYLNDLATMGMGAFEAALQWMTANEASIKGTIGAIASGLGVIIGVIGEIISIPGLDIVAVLGLAALLVFLAPGALIFVALTGFITAIGILSSGVSELATPLLEIKLKFIEFALGIASATDIMPDYVQKALGVKGGIDSMRKALEDEAGAIEGEIEARQRALAVLAMEPEARRIATETGQDYKQMLLDNIKAYLGTEGPSQRASEQLWRMYDAFIAAGGKASDLGFEVDALTGAISAVDTPLSEAEQGTLKLAEAERIAKRALDEAFLAQGIRNGSIDAAAVINAHATGTLDLLIEAERKEAEAARIAAEKFDILAGSTQGVTDVSGPLAGAIDGVTDAAGRAASAADTAAGAYRNLMNAAGEAIRAMQSAQIVAGQTPSGYQGYASGGVTTGEISIVGERGWEFAVPPRGTRILSHEDSMQAVRESMRGGQEDEGGGIQVLMPNATILARDMADALRSAGAIGWGISTAAHLRGSR